MTALRRPVTTDRTAEKAAAGTPHRSPVDIYCLALVIGYGLYRALMNLTYSTALSSVPGIYPLNEANLEFSLATSLSIVGCSAVLVVMGCLHPSYDFRVPGIVATLVLVALNLFSQFEWALPGATVIMPGVYGTALIIANAAWLVPFVPLKPRRCLATLAVCILFNALMTMGLGYLSTDIQIPALGVLGIMSAVLLRLLGHIRIGQPATTAWPIPEFSNPHDSWHATCKVLSELRGPLIIYAAFTALTGFMSAFLFTGSPVGTPTPFHNLALALAAASMAFLSLVMHRGVDLRRAFKVAFPVIALLLVALPFTGTIYSHIFCAGLIFINGIVNISILFLLVDTAYLRQAPIVAVLSATTLIARLCLVASIVAGMALGAQTHIEYFTRMLIVVLGAAYLLAAASMALGRKARKSTHTAMPPLEDMVKESVEAEGAPAAAEGEPVADTVSATGIASAAAENAYMERRSQELAAQYHLTPREREIVLLLARGRTSPYIAEELHITSNTVRSYMREIYVKLDAHSKQEIIDLFS